MADKPALRAPNGDVPAVWGATAATVLFLLIVMIGTARQGGGDVERGSGTVERPPEARADLPNFAAIPAIPERKERFFRFLRPVVEAENARLQRQRERVLALKRRLNMGVELAASDRQWLQEMATRYRVKADEPLAQARQLARRVDIVPASLALAQAALESGWGTSRFARQGNNLFGLWCNTPGCGIVPKRRPEGKTYQVEAFESVGAAVRSYMNDLNSHPAYQPLRDIRARLRAQGQEPTGTELAAGLVNYAAIGEQYVEHIRGVIRRNDLTGAG